LDYQQFKNTIPLLHFMMEYVFIRIRLLKLVIFRQNTGIIKWVSPNINNKLLFFVIYVITFSISGKHWGMYGGFILRFYEDFVEPYFETLGYETEIFWDIFMANVEYSSTAKTYWFFHIMIFSAQLPSFLPSFYRNALKGTKSYDR